VIALRTLPDRIWAAARSAALRLTALLHRGALDDRLDEEVRLHVEMESAAFIRCGMAPEDARRAARLAFGAAERFKDEARDAWRSRFGAELAQDLRYALRAAKRSPLLTSVVVGTLAVTIGLATGAFSAVNAVLLRALPYPSADRLVLIWRTDTHALARGPVSFTNAMDWQANSPSLQGLTVFSCPARPILTGRGAAGRLTAMETSATFFDVLGARPFLGRTFDRADFEAGNTTVVVLGYSLWRDRFGADPGIVNAGIALDGVSYTVVGVLRPEFHALPSSLTCHPDLYRPLTVRYDDTQRSWSFLRAIGRLRGGATLAGLRSELAVEATRQAAAFPEANRGHGVDAGSLTEELTQTIRPILLLVQAGALLVLLIACANVTNLLLARASARRREFGLRVALGADRGRLARQITVECLGLAVLGGGLGVLLAGIATSLSHRFGGLSDIADVTLDARVVAFAVAITLSVAAALSVALVVVGEARDTGAVVRALRERGRGASAGKARLRRGLVAAQVSLALVALVGAALLARSLGRLQAVPPGFDARGVLTAVVALPDATYPRGAKQIAYFRALTERLGGLPGVSAAGAVSILPESPNFDQTNARVVGRAYAPGTEEVADVYRVTPGYFRALAIPLVAGRLFTEQDDDRHPPVGVLNEEMARTLFPGRSAIGQRLWTGAGNTERTIVGVVADVYQYGLDTKRTMQFYVPHAENSGGQLTLVLRTGGNPATLAPAVRAAAAALDPDVPVDQVATMDQVLTASAGRRRLLAVVSLALGLGALVLAAIGLYGVMAYMVSLRTNEIGIRMALGATARDVLGGVVRDGLAVALRGVVPGVAAALVAGRLMKALLFDVTPTDGIAYGGAALVLLLVTIASCAFPARRAARLDPVAALRQE
jgi:putative ABC transport system permease protein